MGYNFIDRYSLLHFAVGIIFYYWGMSLEMLIILHIIFEYIENTQAGMNFINTNFKNIWPGGKDHADSYVNQFGDIVFSGLGWLLAYYVNHFSS